MKKYLISISLILIQFVFLFCSFIVFSSIISPKFCRNQVLIIFIIYIISTISMIVTFRIQNIVGKIIYIIIFLLIILFSINLINSVSWKNIF
jgi:hypothetical protein